MKRWLHFPEVALETVLDPVDKVITDKWFITSDDGVENCCIQVDGYERPMRGRSAMICIKSQNGEFYILSKQNENDYGVPGGGWDIDESPEDAAIRELHEEVLADVKDVYRMGTLIEYHDEVQDWVKEHVPNPEDWWYGYYSAVFVGKYDGQYLGPVDSKDRESGYSWVRFKDVCNQLPEDYREAVFNYVVSYWDNGLTEDAISAVLEAIE